MAPTRSDECADLWWTIRAGRRCLSIGGAIAHRVGDRSEARLEVTGNRLAVLPQDIADTGFAVRAAQSLPGTFEFDDGVLRFTPRFPFVSRVAYAVFLDGERIGTIAPEDDAGPGSTARVMDIYPAAPVVPLNLLKVYIRFSVPMSEGCALGAVHMCLKDTGEPLRDVFLDTRSELWNRDRTRLTMLLDPARIKRGLIPHLEAGYPLREGRSVVVTVGTTFRDAHGQPLQETASRQYEVGPAIRTRVDEAAWHLERPAAGSADPLVVHFDRPLDHALLGHALAVRRADGSAVNGDATVVPGESAWRFRPATPWDAARYALWIDGRLEDLAGNSLQRVFDRDLTRPDHIPRHEANLQVAFRCEPRAGEPVEALCRASENG